MSGDEETASDPSGAPPRWLGEIVEAAGALRELAGAQWQLLRAELRLARAAAATLVIVIIAAAACTVALGLTLLALLGLGFAYWFGSWVFSLVALAVLLMLTLAVALIVARRCVHWLSLPGTRAQWHALSHRPVVPTFTPDMPDSNKEARDDDHASQTR